MDDFDVAQGTLPAGFQFGPYVVGSCIGQGGMARIYRAEHRVLRKPVALKVMEGALLERPDGRPRFLREGQAAAAVKHPNVVDITDVGVWHGRPYLVMELLEGEDLEQHLHRHRALSEQEIARIMIPVVAGLVTAHAAGVIHRDLKPSNIFLSIGADGQVLPKVLDFGISKLANGLPAVDSSATPIGELMGSPMYMSPEAVRGARDLTPQSDQYSLGVILYECVTGRPPFRGDSLLSVLEAVAQGKYESPRRYRPDLSTVLEVAISRAMSTDPSDRFPSLRELGRALCEAADQRTRLLWTPSFGARDVPFNGSTASLGPMPVRTGTGSPLSASVPRAAAARSSLWPLAVAVLTLALLVLGGVLFVRWPGRYAAVAPASVPGSAPAAAAPAAAPASTAASIGTPSVVSPAEVSRSVRALAPEAETAADPAPASAAHGTSRPALSRPPARRRPAPAAAGEPRAATVAVAPAAAAPAATDSEARTPEPAAAPAAPPQGTARDAVPASAADDEVVFPVRAPPPPSRPSTILGANQAPILD